MTTTDPSGLVLPDGSVRVPPSAARGVLAALVRDGAARIRADGGEVSADFRSVVYALWEAAQHQGQPASSVPETPPHACSTVEMTASQAAELLECSAVWIRRLCRTGQITARRAGNAWLIDPVSLDHYRKRTQ